MADDFGWRANAMRVRTIVAGQNSKEPIPGVIVRDRGVRINAGGSPGRRRPSMMGTTVLPTASTAEMTSRTECPRPVPRLMLALPLSSKEAIECFYVSGRQIAHMNIVTNRRTILCVIVGAENFYGRIYSLSRCDHEGDKGVSGA